MPATHNANRLRQGPVTPIVAPMWLGAERRGTGPGAMALERSLRQYWTPDRVGDMAARLGEPVVVGCPEPADADRRVDHRNLAFAAPILQTARQHAQIVRDSVAGGALALSLGGDHALAFGTLTGAAMTGERPGLIWLDTHPDLNTPATSPSGHMHGMPLATALGAEGRALPGLDALAGRSPLIDPADVVILGIRDIDAGERDLILDRQIRALTMEEWHDAGIGAGLERALEHLARRRVTSVHVSFDLDVLDPLVLPGTGTRAPGGLTYREASQVLRRLGEWAGPIVSFDMMELNPLLDRSGESTRTATALLATALGARMLPARDALL